MTEAETIELATIITTNALTGFTIYISLTFAFLTAVHFVGGTLSKKEALLTSAVYLLSAGSAALTTLGNLSAVKTVMDATPNVLSSNQFWQPGSLAVGRLV